MRFNVKKFKRTKTANLAGGDAFVESPELELVSILLTSFVSEQYYRGSGEGVERLVDLISRIGDKRFAAKAAVYARSEFGMRSVSHVAAVELARQVKGEKWTAPFFDKIVERPDDVLEILALYLARHGGKVTRNGRKRPIPNAMKKGFARALGRFDEYQLAKYRRPGADVSLVDAVNLVHPEATDAIGKLMRGELKPAETWEVELTQAGQKAENEEEKQEFKRDAWNRLVGKRKIGYFALLRNLRNIMEQAPDALDQALAMLTDEKLIRKSLVLPFRFITAAEELSKSSFDRTGEVLSALSRAVETSLANVPELDGRNLVALDVSGSMTWNKRVIRIGALFAAALAKRAGADLIIFDSSASYCNLNRDDTLATLAVLIEGRATGGGTDFHSIFRTAARAYDRIIILSDMQAWIGVTTPAKELKDYSKKFKADPVIFSVDLQGYGTLQFPERNVYCLAGFSDKIFDVMKLLETDRKALINAIEQVKL